MPSTIGIDSLENSLVNLKVGKHHMFLDKDDTGISRVLIKKHRSNKWPREPEFMDIITEEVTEGMVAFDLGANIGYITLILADLVGKNGRVYAVEPSPRNFEILTKNIELNNCTDRISAHQLAISDKDGTTSFFLSSSSNLGGLTSSGHTNASIEVEVQMSNTFFSDKPCPNFIKMDIEGAEVEAIAGMIETLSKAKLPVKILMETHPDYYQDGRNLEPCLQRLFEIGFETKYVITAGTAWPDFFIKKGYKPQRVYHTGTWSRGVYSKISEKDVIDAACNLHPGSFKRSFRSCLKRPWMLFNRTVTTKKVVRGILLEKRTSGSE